MQGFPSEIFLIPKLWEKLPETHRMVRFVEHLLIYLRLEGAIAPNWEKPFTTMLKKCDFEIVFAPKFSSNESP